MVKNGNGGNKGKKQGRKHNGDISAHMQALRVRQEEGEMYAVVVKVLGGTNCEVSCEDGKSRMCVIRNKFRGRGKMGNEIKSGVWVMVGLRDWEGELIGKMRKCDLLEVYSNCDKKRLVSDYPGGWDELLRADAKLGIASSDKMDAVREEDFEWADEKKESASMQEVAKAVASRAPHQKITNTVLDLFGDNINIDDI